MGVRFTSLTVVAVVVLSLVAAPSSQARKVLNPTSNLSIALTGGSFQKLNQDPPIQSIFAGGSTFASGASIDGAGAITIPKDSMALPTQHFPDFSGSSNGVNYTVTDITATIKATVPTTGVLNPFNGEVGLLARVKMYVTYTACAEGGPCYSPGLPDSADDCHLGSDADPIVVPMTTGTTAPPGGSSPNTPITGVPYNEFDGSFTIVNNTLVIPGGSTGCDPAFFGIRVSGTFNNGAHLPSPSGYNTLTVAGRLDPIIRRGVIAALGASPGTGVGSLTTTLDASASQAPAGVQRFEFDLDGNGSFETVSAGSTAQATLTTPGTYDLGVRVVDADGDSDVAHHQVVVGVVAAVPPATPPALVAAPLPALSFASIVTLPSAKRCVARRRLRLTLHPPPGVVLRSLRIAISGRKARTLAGAALRSPTVLTRLPRGRFMVTVTVTAADGRLVSGHRRYRACRTRRR